MGPWVWGFYKIPLYKSPRLIYGINLNMGKWQQANLLEVYEIEKWLKD